MKKIAISLLVLFLLVTNKAHAVTIEELQAQLQALLQQISALQTQATNLSSQVAAFERNLSYGLEGDSDVKKLQEILREKGYFSGDATGNYYNLTLEAVKRFQAANGIEPTGFVGPQTRALLSNSQTNTQNTSTITTQHSPVTITPKTSEIIEIISPKPGEVLREGAFYNVRWTGREEGINTYSVYLYDGYSTKQQYLGEAQVTEKDVQVFSWYISPDLRVGSGYQIHLVHGSNVSSNTHSWWSNGFTLASLSGNTVASPSSPTITTDKSTIASGETVNLKLGKYPTNATQWTFSVACTPGLTFDMKGGGAECSNNEVDDYVSFDSGVEPKDVVLWPVNIVSSSNTIQRITFTLTNNANSEKGSVTITVSPQITPTITLEAWNSAGAIIAPYNSNITFSWNSNITLTNCRLTSQRSGDLAAVSSTGTKTIYNVTGGDTYWIACGTATSNKLELHVDTSQQVSNVITGIQSLISELNSYLSHQ